LDGLVFKMAVHEAQAKPPEEREREHEEGVVVQGRGQVAM